MPCCAARTSPASFSRTWIENLWLCGVVRAATHQQALGGRLCFCVRLASLVPPTPPPPPAPHTHTQDTPQPTPARTWGTRTAPAVPPPCPPCPWAAGAPPTAGRCGKTSLAPSCGMCRSRCRWRPRRRSPPRSLPAARGQPAAAAAHRASHGQRIACWCLWVVCACVRNWQACTAHQQPGGTTTGSSNGDLQVSPTPCGRPQTAAQALALRVVLSALMGVWRHAPLRPGS
jgi:hypothetical protein